MRPAVTPLVRGDGRQGSVAGATPDAKERAGGFKTIADRNPR